MKLLRVIATTDPASGGPIEGLKQSSRIMTAEGIEIEIASADAPGSAHLDDPGLPWKLYPLGPGTFGTYSYSAKLRDWLEGHVKDYDAVIIHGNWQHHGLATANACIRQDVPYFIFPHGMLDPWFNETYLWKKLKKQLYWKYEHRILSHAAAVLFTCEEECLRARQSFAPYQVTERVIGYGTRAPAESVADLKEGFERSALPAASKPFLLFMSRIQEKKGLDLLVQAYAEIRAQGSGAVPELVIAGPEQQPAYARKIRTSFDQTGIHWVGPLHGLQKWQALAAAEATVLTSHQENFGIVVAESLSVATPVLISEKVNIWREIDQMGAGLVAPDTLEGARSLLHSWLDLPPSKRADMSARASQAYRRFFDINVSARNLINVIRTETDPDPATATVGIIIPTYDRPKRLIRALRSCAEQTIPPTELIVVDNGPNPETRQIVEAFAEDSPITTRYLRSTPFNLSEALSTGIESATTEWLIILDDDDFLVPDRVKNDLQAIRRCAESDVVLFHDAIRYDYGIDFALWHRIEPDNLDLFHALTLCGLPPTPSSTWRSETVKAHHPYRQNQSTFTSEFSLYAACLATGRARATNKIGYVMDDTRNRKRITTDWSFILDGIQEHRLACAKFRKLTGKTDSEIDQTIDRHTAFFSGKYRGLGAFYGRYSRLSIRHPLETIKGWLSPARSIVNAWFGPYLPIMKGSRSYSLGQLKKENTAIAEYIESQRID